MQSENQQLLGGVGVRKRAALLTILLLLLLAGCRTQPAGETGQPEPPASTEPAATPEQTVSPAPTGEPPEESDSPVETAAPAPTESQPPAETSAPDCRALAETLWERYPDSLSNGQWYAMDRRYWFAGYVPGQTVDDQGEGADGSPLSQPDVYFYEDDTGTMAPEDAAAELLNVMLRSADPEGDWMVATQSLLDRDGLLDLCAEHLAAYTGDWEDHNRLKSWFDAWAAEIPGIGTDMWVLHPSYTGGTVAQESGSWFVIMREGNVYRMQRDDAFGIYVRQPEAEVRIQLTRALEAWGWFNGAPLKTAADARTAEDGGTWYPVEDSRFSTVLDLRMYLKGIFSDEIAEELLSLGIYRDLDGALCCAQNTGAAPALTGVSVQVERESGVKLICRLEGTLTWSDGSRPAEAVSAAFPYEKVGERWVFTEFSWTE